MDISECETSNIDTLFLELSQFTKATTAKELALKEQLSHMRSVLWQIIDDLPSKRYWLDPDVEKEARRLTGKED